MGKKEGKMGKRSEGARNKKRKEKQKKGEMGSNAFQFISFDGNDLCALPLHSVLTISQF